MYEIILRNLCNTHCSELGDKVELAKKEDVVFGGIITGVKSKFTKTGKPCGFVTIEDFEGSGELALFGEDWGNWRGIMVEGSTIFVTAKCVSRYGNSNYLDFKISTVEYLQTVKENRLEKFTIIVDSTVIDETLVNDIKTLVENDEGKAQLFLSDSRCRDQDQCAAACAGPHGGSEQGSDTVRQRPSEDVVSDQLKIIHENIINYIKR